MKLLISDCSILTGWVDITWDNGSTNSYRMGAEGKYDLKILPESLDGSPVTNVPVPISRPPSSMLT